MIKGDMVVSMSVNAGKPIENSNTKKVFCIEGNISVGKSTFVEHLRQKYNCEIIAEPLAIWQAKKDETNQNILELFYKDPKRYAYTFQSIAFRTRLKLFMDGYNRQALTFSERSLFSDRFCFAEMLYRNGQFSAIEWSDYQEWFDITLEAFDIHRKINGYIYLRAEPEVCFERLKQRGRHEEKNMSLEYLQAIHDAHEDWLMKSETKPVLVQDASANFKSDPEILDKMFENLESFIEKISFFPERKTSETLDSELESESVELAEYAA